MSPFAFDVAHMFAGGLVLVSFMMLYQDRLLPLINVLSLHSLLLALSVAWQAHIQDKPDLYVTAAIALGFKTVVVPMALRRMVVRMGLHREIEVAVGTGLTMLLGIGLVALSMDLMLRVTAGASALVREDVALALSVVLLGLLMMVTRRNAVSQVIGFMSLENGLILAGTGARGMPLVVEISVAFSVLIAFIVIGIFLFRIRERFDTVDRPGAGPLPRRAPMSMLPFNPIIALLLTSLVAAAALALVRDYRWSARLNMAASFVVLLFALLLFREPAAGQRPSARRRPQRGVHRPECPGRLHDQRLQRELHRTRTGDRTPHARLPALLPRDVPADDVRHGSGADGQQYRPDVGRHRAGDALDRHDGRDLPDARGARGRLEILHPGQRRHRAGVVRNDPRLSGGRVGHRRGHGRDGVDQPAAPRRQRSTLRC